MLMFISILMITGSCEKFFDPDQDLVIKEEDYFKDWYDYRSAEMGLYSLMQDLAEQLLVLGELRGDLITVTGNANRDLIEVNNFEISELNKYASPRNFYRLIAACNNLERRLETDHPEVLDKDSPITNYDKLYGEIINMRAWAYFNAVRIYRKIPYVPSSVTSIEDIIEFVNSPKTVIDSMDIIYHRDGKRNDTIWYEEPIQLENAWLELPAIVDTCAKQILTKIKDTGVNHYINNNDISWEATIWNEWAMYYLLGQMYLYKGDIEKSITYFNKILYFEEPGSNWVKYGLDYAFSGSGWKNVITSINPLEHIMVMWFGKSHRQTNNFQKLFSNVFPNNYELKPTVYAVQLWETIWNNTKLRYQPPNDPQDPNTNYLRPGFEGIPGDFSRGHRVSYAYKRGIFLMGNPELQKILELKRDNNYFEIEKMTTGLDTVIYKYTLGKGSDEFARDANFIVARAASVHLYAAEIYSNYAFKEIGPGNWQPQTAVAEQFLNDGKYRGNWRQQGVRGRVGFADDYEVITIKHNIIYEHDPFTNRVIGYKDYGPLPLYERQKYLEDNIIEERARELAFEGERFYDLMRVAKKRQDNAFLAKKIASKFSGSQAEMIEAKLMIEDNWYLPFYLGAGE